MPGPGSEIRATASCPQATVGPRLQRVLGKYEASSPGRDQGVCLFPILLIERNFVATVLRAADSHRKLTARIHPGVTLRVTTSRHVANGTRERPPWPILPHLPAKMSSSSFPPRDGYLHFEKAHAEVPSRGLVLHNPGYFCEGLPLPSVVLPGHLEQSARPFSSASTKVIFSMVARIFGSVVRRLQPAT